jgi:hypothetical protein
MTSLYTNPIVSDTITHVKSGPDDIIGQCSLKEFADDKSTTNIDKSDHVMSPTENVTFPKDTNLIQHDVVPDVTTFMVQTISVLIRLTHLNPMRNLTMNQILIRKISFLTVIRKKVLRVSRIFLRVKKKKMILLRKLHLLIALKMKRRVFPSMMKRLLKML